MPARKAIAKPQLSRVRRRSYDQAVARGLTLRPSEIAQQALDAAGEDLHTGLRVAAAKMCQIIEDPKSTLTQVGKATRLQLRILSTLAAIAEPRSAIEVNVDARGAYSFDDVMQAARVVDTHAE